MPVIYVDGDACPVKNEVYKVARRFGLKVIVVANSSLNVPADLLIEVLVVAGFGAADDAIAERIGPTDIAITADIPLAARCVERGAEVVDPKGKLLSDRTIGEAVAMRNLMAELREGGAVTGGPAPMTPKDRSRFLSTLDSAVNRAIRRPVVN
jgi:uncharacterized protein YaiI (UPF0178 family)